MRNSIYLLACVCLPLAAVLSGCTQDEEAELPAGDAVSFKAGVTAVSRTTGSGNIIEWLSTDRIGVFMTANGATSFPGLAGADNRQYSATPGSPASKATFAPTDGTDIYWPNSTGSYDFTAYYPYRGTPGTDPYIYNVSVTDQSTADAQATVDVLWAKSTGKKKSDGAVNLEFDHLMSKITLNVKAGTGLDAGDVEGIAAGGVAYGGMPLTAEIDLPTGTLTAGAASATTFSPLKAATATTNYDATFTAIVVPQAANAYDSRKVVFTIDGEEYTWNIPAGTAFAKGTHYAYPVTVNNIPPLITVGAPSITPWTLVKDGSSVEMSRAGIYTADDLVAFGRQWNAAGNVADADARKAAQDGVIAAWSNDGTVRLLNNIDMSVVDNFFPIGRYPGSNGTAANYAFTGKFDGGGHIISGLTVSGYGYHTGLFGYMASGSEVCNVTLSSASISGSNWVGVIAGVNNSGTISGCTVIDSSVTATGDNSGGIAGYNSGNIGACSVSGNVTVSGRSTVGGIVGRNYNGVVAGCWSTAVSVTADNTEVGGIAGKRDNSSIITGCGWMTATTGVTAAVGTGGTGTGGSEFSVATAAAMHTTNNAAVMNAAIKNLNDPNVPYWIVIDSKLTLTDTDPRYVYTTDEALRFIAWATAYNEGTKIGFDLAEDINLTNYDWMPVGTYEEPFSDIFNGGGHAITGLSVDVTTTYAGLFGAVGAGGMVKDVILIGASIISTNSSVGSIAGSNSGIISGCTLGAGSLVSSEGPMGGGIAGQNGAGSIIDCTVEAGAEINVTASYVGGIVGRTGGSGIVNGCTFNGKVISTGNYTGGIVGYNMGPITGCTVGTSGEVSGVNNTGGIVGYNYAGAIGGMATGEGCTMEGSVISSGNNVGGIAGQNTDTNSRVTACGVGANATVRGTGASSARIGGIVGENWGSINLCYSLATEVSATNRIGGITGYNDGGTVTLSFWLIGGTLPTFAVGSENDGPGITPAGCASHTVAGNPGSPTNPANTVVGAWQAAMAAAQP